MDGRHIQLELAPGEKKHLEIRQELAVMRERQQHALAELGLDPYDPDELPTIEAQLEGFDTKVEELRQVVSDTVNELAEKHDLPPERLWALL